MTPLLTLWNKKIETILEQAQAIPLWGGLPSFPWEEYTQKLHQSLDLSSLGIDSLTLTPTETEWLTQEECLQGLGQDPWQTALELSPLKGKLYWIMPKEDVATLTRVCLSTPPAKTSSAKTFFDTEFQEGFYTYLLLEALHTIEKVPFLTDLSPKLASKDTLPEEPFLAVTIRIELQETTLWGRLLIPASLQQEIKRHCTREGLSSRASPLKDVVEVTLAVELGRTTLSLAEWKGIEPGDFLLIDTHSYNFKEKEGAVSLSWQTAALFQARFTKNSVKILDYALYQKENTPMDNSYMKKNENDEVYIDIEELVKVRGEGVSETPPEEQAPTSPPAEPTAPSTPKTLESVTGEIPLDITVEITRLTLPLNQLLQLEPGNVLELQAFPEQGVDLSLKGKKIAKGELIQIGDVLGVKILEVGH